jgi:CheY-like chemotaxis protein
MERSRKGGLWLPEFLKRKAVKFGRPKQGRQDEPGCCFAVEDEPAVRQLVAFTLQQENFIVLPASNASEALQLLQSHGDVDLLLTDVQMKGMNGLELAEHILRERPGAKALVISGFPDSEILAARRGLPFLSKPFLPTVLVERVRELLMTKVPAQPETTPGQRKMTG